MKDIVSEVKNIWQESSGKIFENEQKRKIRGELMKVSRKKEFLIAKGTKRECFFVPFVFGINYFGDTKICSQFSKGR